MNLEKCSLYSKTSSQSTKSCFVLNNAKRTLNVLETTEIKINYIWWLNMRISTVAKSIASNCWMKSTRWKIKGSINWPNIQKIRYIYLLVRLWIFSVRFSVFVEKKTLQCVSENKIPEFTRKIPSFYKNSYNFKKGFHETGLKNLWDTTSGAYGGSLTLVVPSFPNY